MTIVRVPIAGTVGKAVRINSDATVGAQLGINLYDSAGNVLDAASLASLLATEVQQIIIETDPNDQVFEEEIVDGTILARVADAESITGAWDFTGLTSDFVQFDLANGGASAEGKLKWDADHGALEVGMPGGNVDLLLGQQMLIRCRNTTGVTIPIGSVVYMTGTQGHKPLIALADASAEVTSVILGVTTEEFLNNSNGFITTQGLVHNVNTTGMTAGNSVFLSETAGAFTETRPTPPAIGSHVGHVVEAHASTGAVLLTIFEHTVLGSDVSDVLISAITDDELLQWNAATSVFENQTLAEAGISAAVHTHVEADITDLGTTIVLDSDIGVTVMGYDATMLVDADIGVTVQAYDATYLVDADIGVTVQAYDATYLVDADIDVTVAASTIWTLNGLLQGSTSRDTATPDVAADGGDGVYFHYLTAQYPAVGFDDPMLQTCVYSSDWQTQIAFDFYNHGRIAVRAQEDAVWTAWSLVWDDVSLPATDIANYDTAYAYVNALTATTAEVNLLDLSGLTTGWVLSADGLSSASWKAPAAGGLSNIVEDVTPQLGATLDANAFNIDMGTNVLTDTNLGQFITAYGWGDHASGGYLDAADIGVTVQAYDATYVVDADIGVTVMGYDATMLVDADIGVSVAAFAHTHLLAAGATDVTATVAEVNLLDLAGLTVGWVLAADSATTASWQAPTGGGGGMNDLIDDVSPQLGATLDANTFNIDMGTNVLTDALLGPLLLPFAQNAFLSGRSSAAPDTVGDTTGVTATYLTGSVPGGIGDAAMITQSYSADWQTQLLTDWYDHGKIWVRGQDDNAWSSWYEVWDASDFSSTDFANWGTAYTYYNALTATTAEVNLLDLAGLTAGHVLSADTATTASWKAQAGGGMTDLVDDTTPQLGGDLDPNGKLFTSTVKISGSDDQLWIIDTDDSVAGEHFRIRRTSGVTWFEYYNGSAYELHMRHDDNGGVRLYHNGNQRLITTDAGFIVSGLVNVSTYIQNAEWSSSQLSDIANAVNTSANKIEGAQVWDTNNNLPLWATGSADASTWIDGAGTVIHTPS